jgi:hypothetical protein
MAALGRYSSLADSGHGGIFLIVTNLLCNEYWRNIYWTRLPERGGNM